MERVWQEVDGRHRILFIQVARTRAEIFGSAGTVGASKVEGVLGHWEVGIEDNFGALALALLGSLMMMLAGVPFLSCCLFATPKIR